MSKSGLEFDIEISYLKVMFVFKLRNYTCILIILYSDNTFYLHVIKFRVAVHRGCRSLLNRGQPFYRFIIHRVAGYFHPILYWKLTPTDCRYDWTSVWTCSIYLSQCCSTRRPKFEVYLWQRWLLKSWCYWIAANKHVTMAF